MKLPSWKIGGKLYGEKRLKEIDAYMLKNKLKYSDKEPGRFPPILVPINTPKSTASPIKKALDVAVPSPTATVAVTAVAVDTPVIKKKRSVLDLTEADLKGKRYVIEIYYKHFISNTSSDYLFILRSSISNHQCFSSLRFKCPFKRQCDHR